MMVNAEVASPWWMWKAFRRRTWFGLITVLLLTLGLLTVMKDKGSPPNDRYPQLSSSEATNGEQDNGVSTYETLSPPMESFGSVQFKHGGAPLTADAGCALYPPPQDLPREPLRWQPVPTKTANAYVFSAFYDHRWNPPVLLIIGLASEYTRQQDISNQRYCRAWFKGDSKPRLIAARFRYVPEHHGRKYATAFYMCPLLADDDPPYAVSLVSNCNDPASNILKVIDTGSADDDGVDRTRAWNRTVENTVSGKVRYTVCLALLHTNYSDCRRLVETVELNRSFGASRIVIYDMSSSSDVQLVLDSYRRDGIVEVVPWDSLPLSSWPEWPPRPGGNNMEVHYFGQVAALNDCLYRSLSRSLFTLFTDVDEIVVPRDPSLTPDGGWSAMLHLTESQLASGRSFPGSYMLRNVFFRPNVQQQLITSNVSSLQNWLSQDVVTDSHLLVEREDYVYPYNIRSKYFVWSRAAVMIGIHFPYDFIDGLKVKTVYVNESSGLLHHYRAWSNLDDPTRQPKIIIDRWMDRYRDDITQRIRNRQRAILHLLGTRKRSSSIATHSKGL